MSSVPYTSIPFEYDVRFAEPLRPVTKVAFLFGAHAIYDSPKSTLANVYFCFMFLFMVGVACVAVFVRSSIDLWIQFSLYIVPVITVICGRRFFNSVAFRELLYRLIGSRAMLSSSIPNNIFTHSSHLSEVSIASTIQKRDWLRRMALKCCLYPLFIELIQWTSYAAFQFTTKQSSFAGNVAVSQAISNACWKVLYAIFWSLGVYQVGLLTYQFILVSSIIQRDAISLMGLYGDSPFLWVRKSHLDKGLTNRPSCLQRMLHKMLGIVFMDVFSNQQDMTNFAAQYVDAVQDKKRSNSHTIPARCYERISPLEGRHSDTLEVDSSSNSLEGEGITADEASRILAHFITDIREITSPFVPFTTALLFFSLTNLITHLCIFAIGDIETRHWWTFVRTIIWLLLTIRIIISVARVTLTLGQIPPHVKYLIATGKLQGEDAKWENFLRLTEHFKLHEQSFGFPLTLKQVGIMTAFLKMTFLVILSIMKARPGVDLL